MSDRLRGDARRALDMYTGALDPKPKADFAILGWSSPGNAALVDAPIPLRPGPKATEASRV